MSDDDRYYLVQCAFGKWTIATRREGSPLVWYLKTVTSNHPATLGSSITWTTDTSAALGLRLFEADGVMGQLRQLWPAGLGLSIDKLPTQTPVVGTDLLGEVRDYLQSMIVGAEVYLDADQVVTAYKIQTGALHHIVGLFTTTDRPLFIPVNLPVVKP